MNEVGGLPFIASNMSANCSDRLECTEDNHTLMQLIPSGARLIEYSSPPLLCPQELTAPFIKPSAPRCAVAQVKNYYTKQRHRKMKIFCILP
ncbi:hypothetical protein SK128_011970 [Halocaridina rubra]|uniref:Uncharacterized protein n=1 Tax=Halocaridina rubra TaxID=373956 RepID=A0AAN9AGG1_HALRR